MVTLGMGLIFFLAPGGIRQRHLDTGGLSDLNRKRRKGTQEERPCITTVFPALQRILGARYGLCWKLKNPHSSANSLLKGMEKSLDAGDGIQRHSGDLVLAGDEWKWNLYHPEGATQDTSTWKTKTRYLWLFAAGRISFREGGMPGTSKLCSSSS